MSIQMHLSLISLLFLSPLHLSLLSASEEGGGGGRGRKIEMWCAKTPHPAACLLSLQQYSTNPPQDDAKLYELSVEAAHNEARDVLMRLRTSQPSNRLWADCIELYDNAVLQLNRTLEATVDPSCSTYDTQTWLSAALTNVDTCHDGLTSVSMPLGVVDRSEDRNIAQLISNCLATNRDSKATTSKMARDYPSWATSTSEGRELGELDADVVVAKDGTGNHKMIAAAVASIAKKKGRKVVYIKRGLYRENLNIPSSLTDLTLVGEGIGRTKITGNRNLKDGYTLITSATLAVFGDGFIARDLTIQNTYGSGSQAVALLLAADRSVIYRCRIDGYQDSLCTFSQRQFYRECQILGTVDFIFGNAAAVLQNCTIYPRLPLPGQSDPITAQGRTDRNQNTGIVIHRSVIRPLADLYRARPKVKVYLGRPWKKYSRTVYMQNYISGILHPKGWLEWSGDFALSTLYYAEFRNWGPGSKMSLRVDWPGYHIVVRPSLVKKFTVGDFLAGRAWLPSTGIPFTASF